MGSLTLDDRDRVVLERLADGDTDVETLAEVVSGEASSLRDRLPELADNGLVRRVDDDRYAITDDGRRTIAASPAGVQDDRIDTPPEVDERIESFELDPEAEEALRGAYAFLVYWGDATAGEIIDGVYSERPAGVASGEEWWTECIRPRLDELPTVGSPAAEWGLWRYTGDPIVERGTADGRRVLGGDSRAHSSVRFALESLDLDDGERAAVRAAVTHLLRHEGATAGELTAQVYPEATGGYETPESWWRDCVEDAFASLPSVECTDAEADRWAYRG